jgi:hypothetical protein
MLLWPLDVELRRVSLGRRELADARAWLGQRVRARRGAAPRTAAAQGLLAARERAGGGAARAALRRRQDEDVSGPGATPAATVAEIRPAASVPKPNSAVDPAHASPAAAASASAHELATTPKAAPAQPEESETLARLREAKRRARGG